MRLYVESNFVLEAALNPATAGHPEASAAVPSVPQGGAAAAPALSEKALAEYAGVYRSEELDARWVVRVTDRKLTVAVGGEVVTLLAVEPDVFRGEDGLEVVFVRSGSAVGGARINAGRVRGLEFKKTE